MSNDLFNRVPEFLAAFLNIRKNGFFEEAEFNVRCGDGVFSSCRINMVGYIPSDTKYSSLGCDVLVDPESVIEKLRAFSSFKKLGFLLVEVKSENWPLWDEEGNKIIGSKGIKTCLSLNAHNLEQ